MQDLDLLAQRQIFQDAEAMQQIEAAIVQFSNIASEEEGSHFANYGSGNINTQHGSGTQKNYTNSGPGTLGKYIQSGSGNQAETMYVGKNKD